MPACPTCGSLSDVEPIPEARAPYRNGDRLTHWCGACNAAFIERPQPTLDYPERRDLQ